MKKKVLRNHDTYKARNKFLYYVTSAPKIHIIFEYSTDVVFVVFGADTCQNKGTVHDQHCEEQNLKHKNVNIG